jgi:hypothetical protein
MLTSEVSFTDAFVRTNAPPPVNSLVRLVFTLPPDEDKITLSAHVVSIVNPSNDPDHYPGFAARFVAFDGPPKQRWETLVQTLRGEDTTGGDTTVVYAPLSYLDMFQAQGPAAGDIWLRPSSVEELLDIVGKDIPSGTMLVIDSQPIAPGTNVTLQLVHPVTEAVFALPGVVKRRGAEIKEGVLVTITPLDFERRVELQEMADSVVVLEDYDVELYDEPVLSSEQQP